MSIRVPAPAQVNLSLHITGKRDDGYHLLEIIDNVGHCPHLSAPTASSVAMDTFLARTLRYAAPM